jgi:hypothetical protein
MGVAALPRRCGYSAESHEQPGTISENFEERGQGPSVTAAGLKSAKDET